MYRDSPWFMSARCFLATKHLGKLARFIYSAPYSYSVRREGRHLYHFIDEEAESQRGHVSNREVGPKAFLAWILLPYFVEPMLRRSGGGTLSIFSLRFTLVAYRLDVTWQCSTSSGRTWMTDLRPPWAPKRSSSSIASSAAYKNR